MRIAFSTSGTVAHEDYKSGDVLGTEYQVFGLSNEFVKRGHEVYIVRRWYNGLFTKRRDENNLADAIIHLLESESTREKMGKNARKKVEDYSWKEIAEKTEEVYSSLMECKQ